MHTTKRLAMFVGLIILVGLLTLPAVAAPPMQGGNLLQDPTFDLAAQGSWKWERWSYQVEVMKPDAKNEPDLDQSFYAPTFMPSDPKWDHASGGDVGAAGALSGKISSKFRAGFYQTVEVGKGKRVRFSVWANEFCRYGPDACSVILKAGIDPTGGADWTSGNIKWTAAEISDNKYVRLVTEEVTAGDTGKVTVFTWGEPRNPGTNTAAFFDDAALTSTAASGTTPAEATPLATQPADQLTATAQPAVCAQLRWVSDVTIPDDTATAPGAQFVKTWRVNNAGSCVFSGTLNFVGKGNQMGGVSPLALPKVEAGQQADISINLTAPTQAGDYNGTWQPRTSDGSPMENLVVRIKVSAAAATPVSTATATPQRQIAPTPLASPTRLASPTPATGQICIKAYNDLDGDGQQSVDESLLAGVAFVLSDAKGPRDSYTTDSATEPHCFSDLPSGNYRLTTKPPANHVLTTSDALTVNLSGGMKAELASGAKRSGSVPTPTGSAAPAGATAGGQAGSTGRTVLLVIGVVVLIGLAVAGGFVLGIRRSFTK